MQQVLSSFSLLNIIYAFFFGLVQVSQAQPLKDPFAKEGALMLPASSGAQSMHSLPNFQLWAKTAPPATLSSISVSELSQWQVAGEQAPPYNLFDARDEEEFQHSHIEGSRRVGHSDFSVERVWMYPRNQTIIVYCSNGERSKALGQYLQLMGFEDVRVLEGSLVAWAAQGGKLINQQGKITREIILTDANGRRITKKIK